MDSDLHVLRYQETIDNAIKTFSEAISADIYSLITTAMPKKAQLIVLRAVNLKTPIILLQSLLVKNSKVNVVLFDFHFLCFFPIRESLYAFKLCSKI